MLSFLVALALFVQQPTIAERIAPVQAAYDAELARQAQLPAATGVRERLERMGALDQVGRRAAVTVDFSDLPPDERTAAQDALWAPVTAMDERLAAELLTLVPSEGWFRESIYGDAAAGAAFLIVQHSNVDMWRRFVPVLEPLVAAGEVDGQRYGLMYDRLAINEGRPQRYGTQMTCRDGRWVIDYANLEDPETADARREAMGFMQTLAEYETNFVAYPACTPRP